MVNKPRAKGTRSETLATRWLQDNGWPKATRLALHGTKDHGDLMIADDPRIIAEVKFRSGKISHQQLSFWWQQTEDEAVNAGADVCVLIIHVPGRSPGGWQAWMSADDWLTMMFANRIRANDAPWLMSTTLADWSDIAARWWAHQ